MNKDNLFKYGLFCSVITCCLLFSMNAAGLESTGGELPQKSHHTLMSWLHQVQDYLDSAAIRKVNPQYIEVPEKPWRVILRSRVNSVTVDYENSIDEPEINGYSDWKMRFKPPLATNIGLWVGYRGIGISYAIPVTKNAGRYFSFSTTGAKFGLNFQLRRFKATEMSFSYTEYGNGQVIDKGKDDYETYDPVWIRSIYLNGYYVFNGRRYLQAAAYNQSVIQRRSAGSFLVGATFYHSSFDLSNPKNAGIMLLSHNVGRIKSQQVNIGFGYGYNLVPFRGFVINAMAMPSISVFNRVKVYKYDCNYCLPVDEETADDYGEWDTETKTWANGQTHKPMSVTDSEEPEWQKDIDIWSADSETKYSWLRFNVDLRVGMAYNWKNYFVGLQGQFNNFSYKKDKCRVTHSDWYARASFGVRL